MPRYFDSHSSTVYLPRSQNPGPTTVYNVRSIAFLLYFELYVCMCSVFVVACRQSSSCLRQSSVQIIIRLVIDVRRRSFVVHNLFSPSATASYLSTLASSLSVCVCPHTGLARPVADNRRRRSVAAVSNYTCVYEMLICSLSLHFNLSNCS